MWKNSEKSQVFCILWLILTFVTSGGTAIFAACISVLYGVFAAVEMFIENKEKL